MHETTWRERDGVLRAPAVGRLAELPLPGTLLAPGAPAGVLRVLRREVRLLLPPGAGGVVAERLVPPGRPWVEFDQPVLRLAACLAPAGAAGLAPAGPPRSGPAADGGPGLLLRAPTDGVFYLRPGPGQEPYVREGETIARGAVLGLVEVMKSFHQLVYGRDEAMPDRAIVRRVLPADASEVRQGEVLFHLDPAGEEGGDASSAA